MRPRSRLFRLLRGHFLACSGLSAATCGEKLPRSALQPRKSQCVHSLRPWRGRFPRGREESRYAELAAARPGENVRSDQLPQPASETELAEHGPSADARHQRGHPFLRLYGAAPNLLPLIRISNCPYCSFGRDVCVINCLPDGSVLLAIRLGCS